jgi:tripartite-type tricarboxylate transporter receptor subunit TctC
VPPLKLIVPFTAGTGIDIVARTVGPRLSQRLGRPVVVENRTGASGNIGTEAVVRAPADGNTLLVSVNTLVMNRSLYTHLAFDPVKDLVPVSLTSWGQLILVAPPSAGFKSAPDLVAAAKARPGRLNYASPGVGTPHHMSMELFKQTAGVFLTHIPYRGTSQARDRPARRAGRRHVPADPRALPHIQRQAGRAGHRLGDSGIRCCPTYRRLAEAKAGKVNVDMWYGIFAPPGTSPESLSRLNRELKDILASPEVRHRLSRPRAWTPPPSTPEEFRKLVFFGGTQDARALGPPAGEAAEHQGE